MASNGSAFRGSRYSRKCSLTTSQARPRWRISSRIVFSDSSDYKPPKDWSRTNGLVEDIRQSYFSLDERKRLDEITKPRELKTHDPQRPLEMPAASRNVGAAGGAGGGALPPNDPANPVKVNPQIRNVERVEK